MKAKIFILSVFIMYSVTISGQQSLSVGDKVPLFKAVADDGSVFDLNQFIGKSYIVIYFYPGALTSGCTKQACAYRDRLNDLKSAKAMVVGISGDKIENLRLFREAENLNFPLVSDEKGEIARDFGVPVGAGATFKTTVDGSEHELARDITIKRWTFIADKDGKIVYKNEAVNPEKDTDEVLNFLSMQK